MTMGLFSPELFIPNNFHRRIIVLHSFEKTLMLGKIEGRRRRGWRWVRWVASPTQWTWVWVNSRSWWWTGRPGVLWSMGSQSRTRLSDWTELNLCAGDHLQCKRPGFVPWFGKIPWRRRWQPTSLICLENPMDRGAWQATVHGMARVRQNLVTKPTPTYVEKRRKRRRRGSFFINKLNLNSIQLFLLVGFQRYLHLKHVF